MPATRKGGLKVAKILQARDKDFYAKIGAIGGKNGHTGGFYKDRELARIAGRRGGLKSRRGKAK